MKLNYLYTLTDGTAQPLLDPVNVHIAYASREAALSRAAYEEQARKQEVIVSDDPHLGGKHYNHNPLPEHYLAVACWHYKSGSEPYYVDAMQNQAAMDKAPIDSLYRQHDGGLWVTMRDLAEDHPFHGTFAQWLIDRSA